MRLKRDTQRQRVYDWERPYWKHQVKLELAECREIIKQVARHYKVKPARVKDGRGRRKACYDWGENSIKLPKWSRRRTIVLHEAAHWLTRRKFGLHWAAWHGPEFMGIYLHLLRRFGKFELSNLTETLNQQNVQFKHPDNFKPTSGIAARR